MKVVLKKINLLKRTYSKRGGLQSEKHVHAQKVFSLRQK